MITIGESILRVQSLYSRGAASRDTRLSKRHIYSSLLTARSTLIKQQSSKSQHLNQWMYQTLVFIDLERVPVNQAPVGPKEPTILRSKEKIPKLVSDISAELLSSVSTVDGNRQFTVSDSTVVSYYDGAKYTSKTTKTYIMDGYLYVRGSELLKGLTMQGIFEDPVEVYLFNLPYWTDCQECECKAAEEIEFPIDRDLMRTVLELAQQELVVLFSQMTEDKAVNSSEDSRGRGAMIHQPQSR